MQSQIQSWFESSAAPQTIMIYYQVSTSYLRQQHKPTTDEYRRGLQVNLGAELHKLGSNDTAVRVEFFSDQRGYDVSTDDNELARQAWDIVENG